MCARASTRTGEAHAHDGASLDQHEEPGLGVGDRLLEALEDRLGDCVFVAVVFAREAVLGQGGFGLAEPAGVAGIIREEEVGGQADDDGQGSFEDEDPALRGMVLVGNKLERWAKGATDPRSIAAEAIHAADDAGGNQPAKGRGEGVARVEDGDAGG